MQFNVNGVHSLLVDSTNWEFLPLAFVFKASVGGGKVMNRYSATWERKDMGAYFKATSLVQVVPGHQKSPSSGEVSFLVLKVNLPKKKRIFASCKSPTLVFKADVISILRAWAQQNLCFSCSVSKSCSVVGLV